MKHAGLLIALCVLFGFSSMAQSTSTVEKKVQRITITTKKVDENGKTITETYIAEGNEPTEILQQMTDNFEMHSQGEAPEVIEGDRLFIIRSAGDNQVIEGFLNEAPEAPSTNEERIIIIKDGDATTKTHIVKTRGQAGVWVHDYKREINCAALGVYVNNNGEKGGSRINSLIEKGGAQAAGLKAGDVLTGIEEFDIADYAGLHLALSHFRPGDVVTVRYLREDKPERARVELKDWAQLPGHEWRSRGDCGEDVIEDVTEKPKEEDDPSFIPELKPLELQDVNMFPNPTDGRFELSFQVAPGPLSIAITDVNGKAVYTEKIDNSDGFYNKEIDLKGLPQGNYILNVSQGDKVYTDQISKQ